MVTTGERDQWQPPPTNEEPPHDKDAAVIKDRGSCARAQEGRADEGKWLATFKGAFGSVWGMLYSLVLSAVFNSLG